MNRTFLLSATLGAALLAGCATGVETPDDESDLVSRIRQELALDPLLNTSRVTVTERDGEVVVGGFVDSLEDLDAVRETVEGVEGVASVETNVTVQGDDDG